MLAQAKRPQPKAAPPPAPAKLPLKPATEPAMPMPRLFTGGAALERPSQKKQKKACPTCAAGGATCPKCQAKNAPTLERPPSESQARRVSPGEDPAERQADALGKRIGDDLSGTENVGHGPLPKSVQEVAESHLGVSLEGTHIDAGSGGQRKARDESALAVTEGKDVAFGEGQLSTSSAEGRALLGHELVHVGQQASTSATARQALVPLPKRVTLASLDREGRIAAIRELLAGRFLHVGPPMVARGKEATKPGVPPSAPAAATAAASPATPATGNKPTTSGGKSDTGPVQYDFDVEEAWASFGDDLPAVAIKHVDLWEASGSDVDDLPQVKSMQARMERLVENRAHANIEATRNRLAGELKAVSPPDTERRGTAKPKALDEKINQLQEIAKVVAELSRQRQALLGLTVITQTTALPGGAEGKETVEVAFDPARPPPDQDSEDRGEGDEAESEEALATGQPDERAFLEMVSKIKTPILVSEMAVMPSENLPSASSVPAAATAPESSTPSQSVAPSDAGAPMVSGTASKASGGGARTWAEVKVAWDTLSDMIGGISQGAPAISGLLTAGKVGDFAHASPADRMGVLRDALNDAIRKTEELDGDIGGRLRMPELDSVVDQLAASRAGGIDWNGPVARTALTTAEKGSGGWVDVAIGALVGVAVVAGTLLTGGALLPALVAGLGAGMSAVSVVEETKKFGAESKAAAVGEAAGSEELATVSAPPSLVNLAAVLAIAAATSLTPETKAAIRGTLNIAERRAALRALAPGSLVKKAARALSRRVLRKNVLKAAATATELFIKENLVALRRAGLNFAAHHIVPIGACVEHPLCREAFLRGWDINAAKNGIMLPTASWPKDWIAKAEAAGAHVLPVHAGGHPIFSAGVADEMQLLHESLLDEYGSLAAAEAAEPGILARSMDMLVSRTRERLVSGQLTPLSGKLE